MTSAGEELTASPRGCVICGAEPTHQHHIVKRKLGGLETVPLCPKHHAWADHGKIPQNLLWKLRHELNTETELAWGYDDDEEGELQPSPWEAEYQRDVMAYSDVPFHDFYSDDIGVCLFPPTLHPGDQHVWRQCMISLWLSGQKELDLSRRFRSGD